MIKRVVKTPRQLACSHGSWSVYDNQQKAHCLLCGIRAKGTRKEGIMWKKGQRTYYTSWSADLRGLGVDLLTKEQRDRPQ